MDFLIIKRAGLINIIISSFLPKIMYKGYIETFSRGVLLCSFLFLGVPLWAE